MGVHRNLTVRKKDNNQKDFSVVKQTDVTEGHIVLTSTFYLGRAEPTPEETESRDQEDIPTDNLWVLMDSLRKSMKVIIEYTNNEMEALNRHFNMALEEVIKMWTKLCQMGKPRATNEPLDNDRFTSEMYTKGDSVLLTIKLRLENKEMDTVNKVTGSRDIIIMTLGSATICHTEMGPTSQREYSELQETSFNVTTKDIFTQKDIRDETGSNDSDIMGTSTHQ